MYPLPWRWFWGGKLKRYSVIEAEVQRNVKEMAKRPESHKVREGSVKVVDASLAKSADWEGRNEIILPLLDTSVEDLRARYEEDRTSLGLIRPAEVFGFYREADLSEAEKDFDEGVGLVQRDLYGKAMPRLVQFNHIFKYHYLCPGEACKGHKMQCEDWELFAALRNWKDKYGEEELWESLRYKFLEWMWGKRELYYYLGTHSRWGTWMIIGVYYPPSRT